MSEACAYLIQQKPMVSVIIACLNEEKYIGSCLDSLVANDYPQDRLEVLVVDGISDDGTRETVKQYMRRHPSIKLLDNPQRHTPVAFNTGIKHSTGEVIIVLSAHAVYKDDYISKYTEFLSQYDVDAVGGLQITRPRSNTVIARAVAIALSHPFGVGGSYYRTGQLKEPKLVDTVPFACYRREAFQKAGLYNEKLIRSQDIELNVRLKRAGGKILLIPEAVGYYYPHSDLMPFCRYSFRNGLWTIYPLKYTENMPVSWRHLVPLVFVSGLIGSAALAAFSRIFFWPFLLVVGSYGLANIYFSTWIAIKEKDFRHLFAMPVIFLALHVNYGLGALCGLVKAMVSKQFWQNRWRKSRRKGER